MLNWSETAYKFTIGIGSLGVVGMLAELTAQSLPVWLAVVIGILPLCLFVFATPEVLPVSVVRVAHLVASIGYLITVVGLFGALAVPGPLQPGWQLYVLTSAAGAVPCCIVLYRVMVGRYGPNCRRAPASDTAGGIRPSALLVEYDEFPPVPDDEWDGSELRQAMVFASVLSQCLVEGGEFTPKASIQDDFGAVLMIVGRTGTTNITISFYPRNSSDFCWALQFREGRPLLQNFSKRHDDEEVVGPVKNFIAALVAGEPERFRNPQWLEASAL